MSRTLYFFLETPAALASASALSVFSQLKRAVGARHAAEVAVAGGLLVDRPQQIQMLDDPARRQREMLA